MRRANTLDEFVRSPVGRWVQIGPGVVWVASRTCTGTACWGAPRPDEVRALLTVFERRHGLAAKFDVLLDVRQLQSIDPESFEALVAWTQANKAEFLGCVRSRVSVVPAGVSGYALAGIGLMLDGLDPVRIVHDAREGFRALCGDDARGDALHDEVAAILESVGAAPVFLTELRALLDASAGRLSLAESARRLSSSVRSVQRRLADANSTFRDEVRAARFRAATEILRTTEIKIAAVALRLAITEPALTRLIRELSGLTPARYRAQLRLAHP